MSGNVQSKTPTEATKRVLEQERGARPPVQVWGRRGMVVAMHPAAAQVAADVLNGGGNAFDAAVALSASIAVLCPDWAGLAGDAAWLLRDARSGHFLHLDGYSTCPAAMHPQRLADSFGLDEARAPRAFREEPPDERALGVVTSMVPGTPASWVALASRLGTRPLPQLLAPAIRLAADGFAVNRYLAESFRLARVKLQAHESSVDSFSRQGRWPEEGDLLVQRDLAVTLTQLSETETAALYRGGLGSRVCAYVNDHAGNMSLQDLSGYQPAWRATEQRLYRGAEVVVTGPPTAGIHLLQALAILEGFDVAALGYHSAPGLHCLIETVKQALNQRRLFGGNAGLEGVGELLSDRRIEEMRSAIDAGRASVLDDVATLGASTTHFVVCDAAGNVVTATQSLGSRFGCGEVIAGTGMLMNDRSWWMALAGGPNVVAPGRRANIGHAPVIIVDQGQPIAVLGSPGGFGILQYIVQTLVNMHDHGLDVQDAIEAPRFRLEGLGRRVWLEGRIAADTCAALRALGHEVIEREGWTDRMGGVEGVQIARGTGLMLGGYDPRRNSLAVGLD
jgi:gamma-glutamyltranspeptidase / glutathione hydrolase